MAKPIKKPKVPIKRHQTQTDTKKKAMLEALEKTLGVVTPACKTVGIVRDTHYNWMHTDEAYRAAVESLTDVALDFAESQLHKQIQSGEVSSTIFYLKTKGKKRGYIEKTEHDVNAVMKIEQITGMKID